MDTDNHLENSQSGDRSTINGMKDVSQQEDQEQSEFDDVQQNNLVGLNGMECSEEARPVKSEPEKMDDEEHYYKDEDKGTDASREQGEEASEDGLADGFDEEGPEEDEDEERDMVDEGDALNEPQDLSLMEYRRYDFSAPQDVQAHSVTAEAYRSGDAAPSGGQSASKLRCDICGLSCVSINVLLVHKRSHTGERPFHCTQCGASFTQKGNLLRHIKLHSGEKPFKCHMCNYACRRRDALSGHLRTHSVEKPYKCNHCGRSYKQRSSLEEHRERCHVYVQSQSPAEKENSHTSRPLMGTERALLLDRLASNVAKRKSSMPQKFTGDHAVCLDLSFNRGMIEQTDVVDAPLGSPGPETQLQQQQQAILTGTDHEAALSHRPYPVQLTRNNMSPLALTNGRKLTPPVAVLPLPPQPPQAHSGMDAHPIEGSQISHPLMYNLGHLLAGLPNVIPHSHAQAMSLPHLEALSALHARSDGEPGLLPGAVYPCGHCRVVFLDYVMFTIHMGCHGFRDPLECNVCGHRSRDRYEFSSHIARGEHRLEHK